MMLLLKTPTFQCNTVENRLKLPTHLLLQGLPDDDEKFGAMMPLLTGLMAEAKEFKTPRVWQTKPEKEAAEQHEKLRNRVIEMEKQIYQLETALAKVGGLRVSLMWALQIGLQCWLLSWDVLRWCSYCRLRQKNAVQELEKQIYQLATALAFEGTPQIGATLIRCLLELCFDGAVVCSLRQ